MIELVNTEELYQWDTKRKVSTDISCDQMHFSNTLYGKSIDVNVLNGTADIPDELLQYGENLYVWCFCGSYENGYTKHERVFSVEKRAKPAGYVFTPTEQLTLAEISEKIGDLGDLETENKTDIVSAINEVKRNSVNGGEIDDGEDGATFYPHVDADGNLSWTNDKGLPNPPTVKIKGKDGYTPQKGIDYFDGKDGYTPERGTDYWTDADKAEIKSYVDDAILGGEW